MSRKRSSRRSPPVTKIATCCYCGRRATLHLAGVTQHELACRNCGAPLSTLKALRLDPTPPRPKRAPRPQKRKRRSHRDDPAIPLSRSLRHWKRGMSRFLDDVFDELEDLFD